MSLHESSPIPQSSDESDLLRAVNSLATRVQELTENLTINKRQATRNRRLAIAVGLVFVVVLAFGFFNSSRIRDAASINKETQVQQCENANSVRAASVSLWSTVIGFTAVNSDLPTKAALAALLAWINDLYQQRDCADLSRVYNVPQPPDLTDYFRHSVSRNGSS